MIFWGWLPIDVAHPERTTVGEAILQNAAGPRHYGYGTMRDYLLDFTAIDGTGTTLSGGNLCRLIAGSRGTLGVVTQATLLVRPLPERLANSHEITAPGETGETADGDCPDFCVSKNGTVPFAGKTMRPFRCPICEKEFQEAESPAMPFCSQRCREIDLGRWLDEKHGLPFDQEAREEEGEQRRDLDAG